MCVYFVFLCVGNVVCLYTICLLMGRLGVVLCAHFVFFESIVPVLFVHHVGFSRHMCVYLSV